MLSQTIAEDIADADQAGKATMCVHLAKRKVLQRRIRDVDEKTSFILGYLPHYQSVLVAFFSCSALPSV